MNRNIPTELKSFGFVSVVSCGQYHSVALTSIGQIFTWGSNQHGQLGLDSADELPKGNRRVWLPREVKIEGEIFIDVSAGGFHTLALTVSGQLYVFGRNDDGQLGLGDLHTRRAPTRLPSAMKYVSIAACLRYSLVLTIALLEHRVFRSNLLRHRERRLLCVVLKFLFERLWIVLE